MILMKKKQAILIKVKYMKLMIMISQILMKKMKIQEIAVFKDIEILKKIIKKQTIKMIMRKKMREMMKMKNLIFKN